MTHNNDNLYVVRKFTDDATGDEWLVIETEITCSPIAEFGIDEVELAQAECDRINAAIESED